MTNPQATEKAKEIIESYWTMFILSEFDQSTPWFDQWAKTDEAAAIISSLVGLESSENLIKVLRMIQQELACATNSSNGGKANLNSTLALVSAALEQIDNRKNNNRCKICGGSLLYELKLDEDGDDYYCLGHEIIVDGKVESNEHYFLSEDKIIEGLQECYDSIQQDKKVPYETWIQKRIKRAIDYVKLYLPQENVSDENKYTGEGGTGTTVTDGSKYFRNSEQPKNDATYSSEGLIHVLRMIEKELLDVSFWHREDMKRAIEDCLLLASVALDQIYNRKK